MSQEDHMLECAPCDRAPTRSGQTRCLSLIGMPGSGKSTLAAGLARRLGWAFLDTDHLMEAWYGLPLENLRTALGRERFLQVEEETVCSLDVRRCIIATGGSVIYSTRAVQALQTSGLIVYLQADYESIEQRVSLHPERGLVMGPGQTLYDLYLERTPLYERAADLVMATHKASIQACITTLEQTLHELWPEKVDPEKSRISEIG